MSSVPMGLAARDDWLEQKYREEFLRCIKHKEDMEIFMDRMNINELELVDIRQYWRQAVVMLDKHIRMLFNDTLGTNYEGWNREVLSEQLVTLDKMRHFERELRYTALEHRLFPLPRGDYGGPNLMTIPAEPCGPLVHAVLARILFLLQRNGEGRSTFPTDGSLRYDDEDFCSHAGAQNVMLPLQYKFLCYTHRRKPLPLEWEAVVGLVGWLTRAEHRLVEKVYGQFHAAGLVRNAKSVEAFTTPATSEAVASDCGDCPICTKGFAEAGTQDVEPAVKTQCGHFMGKECLQAWVDGWVSERKKGLPTCPNCRAPLNNLMAMLPRKVQPVMREWVAYARSDRELDSEVDAFLLAAREPEAVQCFDVSLGAMLEKLETRRNRFLAFQSDIQTYLEHLLICPSLNT